MAKKGRRREPRRQHLRSLPTVSEGSGDQSEDQELIRSLRRTLREPSPMSLLTAVSMMLTAVDPRRRDPFGPDESKAGLDDLIDSFVGSDFAETTAVLTVMRAMLPDELLAARLGKVLTERRQPLPAWLADLDVRVHTVLELTEELGDGDDYIVGARLGSGQELTALVYVDHNLGTVVKDAFVVDDHVDTVTARMRELAVGTQGLHDFDPATARAIVTEAIEHGAMIYPPIENDTWPGCRPLVEWLVRHLPSGGSVPERREWTDNELAGLAAEFFASPQGRRVDGPDERSLLEDLLWFGSGWGPGDPLRWSPVNVEIVLSDWFPRKIAGEPPYLTKLPGVLRAYVEYCHQQRGVSAENTGDTMASIDRWEPEFQRLIRTERLQGAHALASMLVDAETSYEDVVLGSLDRAVGGRSVLMNLEPRPLPDEAFEWAGVPADIVERVQEVLHLTDACADALLDAEHRTAMRRFLGRAAVADPAIFRRKGRADTAAAAVAWVITKANNSVGYAGPVATAKDLLAWFGLTGSVSQRAEPFLKANGVDPYHLYGQMELGAPDLLVGRQRARIIELRDRYLELARDPG